MYVQKVLLGNKKFLKLCVHSNIGGVNVLLVAWDPSRKKLHSSSNQIQLVLAPNEADL
jgi:hypothetical protein